MAITCANTVEQCCSLSQSKQDVPTKQTQGFVRSSVFILFNRLGHFYIELNKILELDSKMDVHMFEACWALHCVWTSTASWRTWSLAIRAMAPLVQPTARVHPQAPSPPLFLPVELLLAAQVPALLKPPLPPRLSLSHHPCQHRPRCLPLQRSARPPPPLWTPSLQLPSLQNTCRPRLRPLAPPFRNAALFPAGSDYLLLRPLLLPIKVP